MKSLRMSGGEDRDSHRTDDAPGLQLRMTRDLGRMHEQHRKLQVLLRDVFDRAATGAASATQAAFEPFRDALTSHLRLEDEVYFPALHGLEPELESELLRLAHEHGVLRERLESMEVALSGGRIADFLESLDLFVELHSSHERHEETIYEKIRGRTHRA